jgi:hypothetical protein
LLLCWSFVHAPVAGEPTDPSCGSEPGRSVLLDFVAWLLGGVQRDIAGDLNDSFKLFSRAVFTLSAARKAQQQYG